MQHPYDQFAKRTLATLLEDVARLETEQEVTRDARTIDVACIPQDLSGGDAVRLGILGRMLQGPCLFEACHDPPSPETVRRYLGKHFDWPDGVTNSDFEEGAVGIEQYLWILSAGRPETVLDEFEMRAMVDWPRGMYVAPRGLRLKLVVISELPSNQNTLSLRLLGRGRTLRRALRDLFGLSENDFYYQHILPLAIALYRETQELPEELRSSEDEEFIMDTQEIFDEYKEEWINEGRREGRRELLALAETWCSDEEYAELKEIDDLRELRIEVARLIQTKQDETQ